MKVRLENEGLLTMNAKIMTVLRFMLTAPKKSTFWYHCMETPPNDHGASNIDFLRNHQFSKM